MKKMILSAVMLAVAAFGRAQEKSEWLPSFTAVTVDGPVEITFVRVPDTEAPKITYDTKGSYTTKFQAEVRDKVLTIRERPDSRRPERTVVVVRYNELQQITLSDAVATFADTLRVPMLDLIVGGGASVVAPLDVKDLRADLSGSSSATLSGRMRYLTLMASTGRFDALGAACMSAQVNAQSKADVRLNVTDRLQARTSTNATIRYKGNPPILRTESRFLAGEIKPIE